MANIFENVMVSKPPRSWHNLSHVHKTTFDPGQLIPTCRLEVLPGDKWKISSETMLRFTPMLAPIYHHVEFHTHWWFVPNRILWDDWEDWITGNTEVAHPDVRPNVALNHDSLGTYLGYKYTSALGQEQNAFPVAAYMKIYDEWYRAQHIETTPRFEPLQAGSSQNTVAYKNHLSYTPPSRAWEHDYFTSALPFPQLGDAVTLPLLDNDNPKVQYDTAATSGPLVKRIDTDAVVEGVTLQSLNPGGTLYDGTNEISIDPNENWYISINDEAVDINTLREAFALQRYLEKEARAGTRYVEHNLAFFGVRSSDARLQRPEYICGSKGNMVISEVLSTADSGTQEVGSLAGHGIGTAYGKKGYFQAEEHGWIIAILSVRPKTEYWQGIHKSLLKNDKYDYANPMFARLGEQAIQMKELYFDDTDTQENMDATFGYVPRYADYKHMNSFISGEFVDTLEFWHMGRKFTTKPALNTTFIKCFIDKRQFASAGAHTIYALVQNNVHVERALPKYATPSIVG